MAKIHFGYSNTYLQRVKNNSTSMELLAQGDGTEVILQNIKEGKNFCIYPGDDSELLEFFYILEGRCACEQEEMRNILRAGDYFYAQGLEDVVFFKPLTDMKIMWVSSRPIFDDVCHALEELIEIVRKVEKKDSYTYQHTLRVQEYAFKVAKEMNLEKTMIGNIYDAAILHDVGKIDIPEEVLKKRGRLTDDEYACMKAHTIIGYHMVKDKYDHEVARIIAQHHERLDGSGYPLGLMGHEICFEAKVIAVADTYDAMTSTRPYRKGFTADYAMDELRLLSGTHYESDVVEALERVLIKEGVIEGVLEHS